MKAMCNMCRTWKEHVAMLPGTYGSASNLFVFVTDGAEVPPLSCSCFSLTYWKSQSKLKTGIPSREWSGMDASAVVAICHDDGHMTRGSPVRPSLFTRAAASQPSSRCSVCIYIFLLRPLRSPCCVCCVPWEYTVRIHNCEAGESFEY